jgi:ankyrin repeat protein
MKILLVSPATGPWKGISHLLRLQIWISVLVSCMMLCACANQVKKSDSSLAGMMPSGRGWVIHEADGANVILGKITNRGMRHSVIAYAGFQHIQATIEEPGPTRRDIGNADELLRWVKKNSAGEYQGPRFKDIDIKSSIVRYSGNDCVQVDFIGEDHGVPGAKGLTLILAGREYYCLHPASTESAAAVVRLSISQRYVRGIEPLLLDSEVAPFFKTYLEGSAMPLIKAAKEGDIESVRRLVATGTGVNAKSDVISDWGKTALMEASLRGHADIVGTLIKAGADVNVKDDYGETALMFASGKGHYGTVKLLLGAGAAVNVQSTGTSSTALMCAAKNGHDLVVQILMEAGADINATAKGSTALLLASWRGATLIIETLIERGADVNAKDHSGMTPLMFAAADGRILIAKKLIEKGADVNAKSFVGHTPLSLAKLQRRVLMAEILKKEGAKE